MRFLLILGMALSLQSQTTFRGAVTVRGVSDTPGPSNGPFRRLITIDHTKVPNTDQTSFPVAVAGTYSYLATVANGGKVKNASGFDVGFYTNTDCSTGKMDWETEMWTASNGKVVYWVRVASLSHTVDTSFYLCYGNAAITTDQSNKTGVWDSHYKVVYHMNQDPSGGTVADSTSNANTGTVNGSMTSGQLVAAAVGNGLSFTTGSAQYITFTTNPSAVSASLTWQAIGKTSDTTNIKGLIGNNGTAPGLYIWSDKFATFYSSSSVLEGTTDCTTNVNFWLAGTLTHVSAGVNTKRIYVNGTQENSATLTDATYTADRVGTMSTLYFRGVLDEVRASDIDRSADWLKTEYNNQNSPSTFYSIGSES